MSTLIKAISEMSELTSREKKRSPHMSYAECCRHVYETQTPDHWKFDGHSQFKLKKAFWEKAFKKLMSEYQRMDHLT